MSYVDPVKKLEQEIAAMEKAQREQQESIRAQVAAPAPGTPATPETPIQAPAAPAEPVAPAVTTPEPAAPAVPVEDPNSETFKARWESLQGIYRQTQQQLQQLQQQYGVLLNDNAAIRQQLAAAPQPIQAPPAPERSAKLEAVKEKYGAEFVDTLLDMVRDEVKPLETQVQSVKTETANSAQARLESSLTALAPNWQTLRFDDGFNAFIQQSAPGTGVSYQVLLVDAYTKHDGERAAAIFNLYKPVVPAPVVPAPVQTSPVVPVAPPAAMIDPARRGNGATVVTEPQGKAFTESQVNDYYRNLGKIAGKYQTPPEMVQLGKEIDAAAAAGRIIPG